MEWGLGVLASVIVAFVTAQLSLRAQRERMEREQTDRLDHLREELKLEYSIETAIKHLLNNENYKKQSLKKIKHHIRGFENDDELRRHLVRAGAVAFGGEGDDEKWGLLSLNKDDVK